MPDYKGVFEGYNGGTIDLVNTLSGSHVTGDILVRDFHRVFEHEWHIAPNQMFPHREPESGIRWELKQDDGSNTDTLLVMTPPPHQIDSFNFNPWLACLPRSTCSHSKQTSTT